MSKTPKAKGNKYSGTMPMKPATKKMGPKKAG